MRDIINLVTEAGTLAASELLKYDWRFERFIEKILAKQPFEDLSGNAVIIDPKEANRLINLKDVGALKGAVTVNTVLSTGEPGNPVALSTLKKTADLQKVSGEAGQASKEHLLVKPSQIGITDKKIPATELHRYIAENTVLNSSDYGRVVIDLANKIASGKPAVLPQQYASKEQQPLRKAIVDYAGEYLGVLALVTGQSRFSDQDAFLEWLGSDFSGLELFFPSKANTNLADSYASITNKSTNHTLNISSKGTGGGAAPAISGLKIPGELAAQNDNPAVEFIKICQKSDRSGGPTTITSAFDAVDLIYRINPDSLPKELVKLLPFSQTGPQLMSFVVDQIKNKDMTPLPSKYDPIVDQIKSDKATPSGKLVYYLKNAVMDAINKNNAIPEFAATVLEILEMNFIQQYADYNNGVITFETQWPAKLKGRISVEHKSSAVSPTDGGFSFKLGRAESPDADSDLGAPGPEDNEASIAKQQAISQKISDIAQRKSVSGIRPPRGRAPRSKR